MIRDLERFAGALCVAAMVATTPAHAAPWAPAGPVDGQFTVATHPTTPGVAMIGGGHGSLSTWFTKDGGASWIGNAWRGATERPLLAGVPTVAWMTRSSQLLRSVDQGRSWAIVDAGFPDSIDALSVNPIDPNEVVIGGSMGVQHTRNGGATWALDPGAAGVSQLAVDWSTRRLYVYGYGADQISDPTLKRRPLDTVGAWTTLQPARVAAARGIVLATPYAGGVLLRSIDGGTTFAPVETSLPLDAAGVVFASDATSATHRVYATYHDATSARIARSDDDGATWSALPSLFDFSVETFLAVDAGDANRVYVVAGHGVHVSHDGGATFQPFPRSSGAPAGTQVIVFDALDPLRQWTTTPIDFAVSGIPRTTDGGATWTEIAPAFALLGASRTRTNTLFGTNVFLGTGGLAVSRNGGDSWTFRPSSTFTWFGPVGFGAPGEVYIAGRGFEAGTNREMLGVLASVDDGDSFVERPAPPLLLRAFASSTSAPAVIYAGGAAQVPGGPQLWRSTDRSLSWQPIHHFPHPWIPGPASGNDVIAIAVDPIDANRLYAGLALPDHLMRSEDGGATWTRATVGLGAGAVTWIAIDQANPAIVYAAQHGSGVFRSTDRGQSWAALDEGLRDDAARQVVLSPHVPGALYAGTDSGLWRANLLAGLPSGHRRAIEFYHPGFDHYFVSADLDEIAGLDAGVFAGWVRTGEGFRVAESAAPGNQAACRFFGIGFGATSSHFYTPYPGECEIVKADPNWQYEKIAFGLALPDPATRGCPPDARPLYRAWNRNVGGAPNHRYNSDLWSVVLSVLRQGWILEGDAATLVFACVPVE